MVHNLTMAMMVIIGHRFEDSLGDGTQADYGYDGNYR